MVKKEERKKELQRLIDIAEDETLNRFSVWDNMIYAKSKLTILEAKTAEEMSQKWDDFYVQNGGKLGSIWSVDDKKHYVDNGIHFLMIQYKQFSLREGFNYDVYKKAIEEYERSKVQLKNLKEKMKMFKE